MGYFAKLNARFSICATLKLARSSWLSSWPKTTLSDASRIWTDARACPDLVSFHGRYLSKWSSMVGPSDGSSRDCLSSVRQLLCLGGGLCGGSEASGSPTAE